MSVGRTTIFPAVQRVDGGLDHGRVLPLDDRVAPREILGHRDVLVAETLEQLGHRALRACSDDLEHEVPARNDASNACSAICAVCPPPDGLVGS